jgi:anti-sigma B factor antagonist
MELGAKTTLGKTAVLNLAGRIRMADTEALENALNQLIGGSERQFILDMSKVNYVCSSALGALIALKRQVLKLNGEIRLIVAPGEVLELLRLTMVDKVFPIHSEPSAALRAFGESAD